MSERVGGKFKYKLLLKISGVVETQLKILVDKSLITENKVSCLIEFSS